MKDLMIPTEAIEYLLAALEHSETMFDMALKDVVEVRSTYGHFDYQAAQ
jgi:hypothetical protein